MKNILTIMRRDLAAFYTSPIGYIFMIVFLAIGVGLYMTGFFTFPVADMRSFFSNLPLLLCVFVPAVTMRAWAEERKENTWELLLTFPMRARELALGKFLAMLSFVAITLAGTLTVPLMLMFLGKPDFGAIFGGYLGTVLLSAFFLSIGLFFSGFCKDQIVAFVVTLLACFLIFLLGTDYIASYIDDYVPGLGSMLSNLVGIMNHYTTFVRGVVDLADVLFFVVWTVLLLVLNIMYIEERNRPGARMTFAGAIVVSLAIGLAFNWLVADTSLYRKDLTQDQSYTMSPASKTILSKLPSPVQIKVYITPKSDMPTALKGLEQDITDKLAELKIAAGGKLEFTPVYLKASNVLEAMDDPTKDKDKKENSESEKIEKRMLDKGVQPFMVQALVDEELTQKPIYSTIGVGYKAGKEEMIPQVMPQNIAELEYRIVNIVYKLTRETPPHVALVAPKESVSIPPQLRQLYAQMGQPVPETEDPYDMLEKVLQSEKYTVDRVDLNQHSPLPATYDTLVIINPRELNDRQLWEINRALVAGKSVVLAVQTYTWDYRISPQGGLTVSKREENPKANELLKNYGLGVSEDVLMDENKVALTIRDNSNPLAAMMGGGSSYKVPTQMLIYNATMDADTSITSRLDAVFYLWGTAVTVNNDELKKYGLTSKVLMNTSKKAWEAKVGTTLAQADVTPPVEGKQYPLMAMVTGQFPDAYKGKPRPAWPAAEPQQPGMPPTPPEPEADAPATDVKPAPGKLILVGCSQMFNKNFLQAGNADLFLNCVDATTLGDDLVKIRGRKPIDRTIDKPTDMQRRVWKFVNYALVNISIAVVGIAVAAGRRQSRNAYTVAMASGRQET